MNQPRYATIFGNAFNTKKILELILKYCIEPRKTFPYFFNEQKARALIVQFLDHDFSLVEKEKETKEDSNLKMEKKLSLKIEKRKSMKS